MSESGKRIIVCYYIFLVVIMALLITIILLKRAINRLKYIIHKNAYERTTYFKQTNVPYDEIMNRNDDEGKGRRGEYIISLELNEFEKRGAKLLFNSYLPKGNSQYGEFSETDIIFLHSTGIYVIESKNYEGFIWGDEAQQKWRQSVQRRIRSRKREKIVFNNTEFYNPILQNQTHIEALTNIMAKIDMGKDIPIYSLIVFSNKGILKRYERKKWGKYKAENGIKTSNPKKVRVINTRDIGKTINQMGKKSKKTLTQDNIEQIYEELRCYSQVREEIKLQHINGIKQKRRLINKNSYKS